MLFKSRPGILAFLLLPCLALTACHFPPRLYHMDIAQGNIVTQKMLDQLTLDMSKEDLRHTLGSPALEPAFDKDRWDYYYHFKTLENPLSGTKHLSFYFRDDKLQRFEMMVQVPLKTTEEHIVQLMGGQASSKTFDENTQLNTWKYDVALRNKQGHVVQGYEFTFQFKKKRLKAFSTRNI